MDDANAILGAIGGLGPFSRHARRALRMLTLAECAGALPRGYIVKGLIAPRDVVVLFGPPGAGKSVVAPYLAHAIATGRLVFGRRVRPGPALYIAAEDGTGMLQRAAALRRAVGEADTLRIVPEAVDLQELQEVPREFGDHGPPGLEPVDLAPLVAAARSIGAVAIVLDTLSRCFPGLDENDGRSMGLAVRTLRALAEATGAAIIVVHHGAKGSEGGQGGGGSTPRGHGILNGDADVTLRIELGEDGLRTVRLGKNRNGSTLATLRFTVRAEELGTDEDGDAITAPVAEEVAEEARDTRAETRARAEARLSAGPAMLLRELRFLADGVPLSSPEPGMPLVRAVERDTLRVRLIARDWYRADELRADTVSKAGNTPDRITRPAQSREWKALAALQKAGFAGFNQQQAWPT